MADEETISDKLLERALATTMMRGDLGHGRKAKPMQGALARMAEFGPVDTHFYDEVSGGFGCST